MAHLHLPRVLITDDEAIVRKYLSEVIKQAGMESVEAADGDSALLALRQSSIDLVLLDVRMPGRDGFTVLHQIRLQHQNLPVILMTGEGNVADAVKAIKCGAADYLTKPLHLLELLEKLRSMKLDDPGKRDLLDHEHDPFVEPRTSFHCPNCQSESLVPSQRVGWEPLALLLLLRPYRCLVCYHRSWHISIAATLISLVGRPINYLLFNYRWGKDRSTETSITR